MASSVLSTEAPLSRPDPIGAWSSSGLRRRNENSPAYCEPPWTAEDDELLRAVLAAGTDTVTIAARLLRSQSAIRNRARKFGILLPAARKAGNPNWHGGGEDDGEMTRPWTDDEMHRLRVFAKGKVSAYYIAKSLGRSAGSAKLRARSLGLILYKKAKAKVK
jgi:hypothetical protein